MTLDPAVRDHAADLIMQAGDVLTRGGADTATWVRLLLRLAVEATAEAMPHHAPELWVRHLQTMIQEAADDAAAP